MAWHRQPWLDIGLRGGGLLSLGIALWAARELSAPAAVGAHGGATVADFVLALLAFLCGTIGAALLIVGAHLFDPVELGARWRRFGR